ncbi:MAG: NADH-quinone oxidoreductase subunit J [Candidatus Bipolaricaulota bacterium]|nr:NADH-quinone oxidoreductase subunit J [Candidatus Bipolaricaulota bacterium]
MNGQKRIRSLLVFALFVMLLSVVLSPSGWQSLPRAGESFRALGEMLFGAQVLAFELLSVLLLAALVGAILLARRSP